MAKRTTKGKTGNGPAPVNRDTNTSPPREDLSEQPEEEVSDAPAELALEGDAQSVDAVPERFAIAKCPLAILTLPGCTSTKSAFHPAIGRGRSDVLAPLTARR